MKVTKISASTAPSNAKTTKGSSVSRILGKKLAKP
jgi:hypothetical protein